MSVLDTCCCICLLSDRFLSINGIRKKITLLQCYILFLILCPLFKAIPSQHSSTSDLHLIPYDTFYPFLMHIYVWFTPHTIWLTLSVLNVSLYLIYTPNPPRGKCTSLSLHNNPAYLAILFSDPFHTGRGYIDYASACIPVPALTSDLCSWQYCLLTCLVLGEIVLTMLMPGNQFLHLLVILYIWWYCFLDYLVLEEAIN